MLLRAFPVVLLCLLLAACSGVDRPRAGVSQGERLGEPTRPNIIYILADDLGYGDLGSYGQTQIKTPNLDALAATGLRFTDHYAGATVCAPSRCVLMTGKHVGVCFTRGNYHGPDGYAAPMPKDEPSLARVLKQAGYSTACIGKWGLGGPEAVSAPNAFGFDFFYGFLDQKHAHNHYPDYLWRNDKQELTGNVMTDASRIGTLGAGVAVKRKAYANDLFFEESQQWIAQKASEDKPFFLYLALTVPHANNEASRLLKHMPEDNREQKGQEVPDLGQYVDMDWPGPQKGTAAMITRFDEQIGQIVDQLETLGLTQDTLIIFTSDNGPHAEGGNNPAFFDSNGPLRGIKRDLYDGGIRVPMIANWPGTITPGTTDLISAFDDVLPTLADLADADAPAGITGVSFEPTLLGANVQVKRNYLYWEFFEQKGKQAVRVGKWKGIRLKVHENKDAPIMLYDILADPGEQNDVADQHPEVVAQIKTIMIQARTRSEFGPYQFSWEK